MKQINTGYEERAPTRQRISCSYPQPPQKYGGFLMLRHRNTIFTAAKRQKVRKNIWHFLLRQSVYFKRS